MYKRQLLLTVGHLGDLRGRRLLFAGGMGLFMVASLFAGSAQIAEILIGARLLQGVGASAILTSTLATLNSIFRGRERAIAFAVYGATIGGMAAVGPLVGGWPVSYTHLDVYKRQPPTRRPAVA